VSIYLSVGWPILELTPHLLQNLFFGAGFLRLADIPCVYRRTSEPLARSSSCIGTALPILHTCVDMPAFYQKQSWTMFLIVFETGHKRLVLVFWTRGVFFRRMGGSIRIGVNARPLSIESKAILGIVSRIQRLIALCCLLIETLNT